MQPTGREGGDPSGNHRSQPEIQVFRKLPRGKERKEAFPDHTAAGSPEGGIARSGNSARSQRGQIGPGQRRLAADGHGPPDAGQVQSVGERAGRSSGAQRTQTPQADHPASRIPTGGG